MKRWVVLVGLAACAHPTDSPERFTGLVHTEFVDDKVRVVSQNYQVTYGADGTVLLPEQLAITGAFPHANVLGANICPLESLMGVAMYPGTTATGGQSLTANGETGVSVTFGELDGPAVARIRSTYTIPYRCGSSQHLTGEQTLTFFPDGRIVRRDVVTSSDTPQQGGICGCASTMAPEFIFSLFYTFSNDATLVDSMDRAPQAPNPTQLCAQWPDLTIGVRWLDAVNTRAAPNGRPAFVLDMMRSSLAPFPVMTETHTSIMMIASAETRPSCGSVLAQISQPALEIDGQPISISAEDDGLYVDTVQHASTFTISAAQPVSPFAVLLKVGDHAKFTSSVNHGGGWYTVQFDPRDQSTIVWFAEGLAQAETITVEPL